MAIKITRDSPQITLFDTDLFAQLDQNEVLIKLAKTIDWMRLEDELSPLYSNKGRQAKPIRLMVGLLILKQRYGYSDETVVLQVKMNPYFQYFLWLYQFSNSSPLSFLRANKI